LVQLGTRNSALALYGILLVLPTVVLGGLLWRQLQEDHDTEMAAVPADTMNAARNLSELMQRRLQSIIEHESQRPFYLYKRNYFPPGTIGAELALVPSQLATGPIPEGILAWFTHPRAPFDESEVDVLGGDREKDEDWPARRTEYQRTAAWTYRSDKSEKDLTVHIGDARYDLLPLAIAAVNASQEPDPECLRSELPALRSLENESLNVKMFSFNVHFYREPDGTPRVLAKRFVSIDRQSRLWKMPACFDRLARGLNVVQGFFIDPDWVFSRLPKSLANSILTPSQEFVADGTWPPGDVPHGSVMAWVSPVKELDFIATHPEDEAFGRMRIIGNTANLEARYRSQTRYLLGVAAMLVLSLGTGLALLLRSVRRDLDAAQRTENFVAAVTHELRTPLSAIRMHGEMLKEGWVQEEPKRQEYYRRIVRETDRLETMVERVLEKSRLSTADATPEPGDVNAIVEGLGPSLIGSGTESPARDVVFELAPELPSARLVPDGVRSIVTNLVENARKYAPVDTDTPGSEPIRVATLLQEGAPVLEVRDRGPGIPREERSRIFDAFYRVGNETTRTAKGTGLGLHLAALHCEGMGARIQALDRDGGGTIFRVTFERA
jgi:signal transduction histidine kinase